MHTPRLRSTGPLLSADNHLEVLQAIGRALAV